MKILIAGVPRAGKTTLAADLGVEHGIHPLHTDDLIDFGWSGASDIAADWISSAAPWIIEGVAVPRALRKWIESHEGSPADVIYWLSSAREELSAGQESMADGCRTVFEEVEPELTARGVRIERA